MSDSGAPTGIDRRDSNGTSDLRRTLRSNSIRTTWLRAAALFVSIALAMGVGSLVTMRAQREGFDGIYSRSEQKLSALARLQREILEAEVPIGGVLYELNRTGELQAQWVQWRQHAATIDDLFDGLLDLTIGADAKVVADARGDWMDVVAGVADARGMWGSGEVAAALAAGNDPFGPTVWTSLSSLEHALASAAVAGVEDQRLESATLAGRQQKAEVLLIVGLAVALTFAVLSGRRLSGRVIRPLLALRQAVGAMRDGDLTAAIDLPRTAGTEVLEVAHAVSELARSLDSSQRRLRNHAYTDGLTGLANRRAFGNALDHSLAVGTDLHTAVLLIDIDDFKFVNDSLGHNAGDELLRTLAGRLRTAARDEDVVARFGGDEFAIIVEGNDAIGVAAHVAARILDSLGEPVTVDGHEVNVGCSIGIADGHTALSAVELIRHADAAMYVAKSRGKRCFEQFDPTLHATMMSRSDLRNDLRRAVELNQLELHYQPIFDLSSGDVIGLEALVRWNHPTRGLVMPDDFIDAAEESGDIVAIGEWVIDKACADLAGYHAAPPVDRRLWVTVNVSPRQVLSGRLVGAVRAALARHDIDPASFVIELTEAALLRDTDVATAALDELRSDGVRVALDDFGTGFASLQYLQRLPVDVIKIDRSFIAESNDTDGAVILEAIVAMGHGLGLDLVAEGIERDEDLDRLCRLGRIAGQGYLMAPPMPAARTLDFLDTRSEPSELLKMTCVTSADWNCRT